MIEAWGREAIERDLAQLRVEHPSAFVRYGRGGVALVTLPDVRLKHDEHGRKRWDRDTVTLHFVLSPGYPGATPDATFWAYPTLGLGRPAPGWLQPRHTEGGIAQWSWRSPDAEDFGVEKGLGRVWGQSCPPPGFDGYFGRRFLLHLQAWNPNHDNLYTVAKVVLRRLQAFE